LLVTAVPHQVGHGWRRRHVLSQVCFKSCFQVFHLYVAMTVCILQIYVSSVLIVLNVCFTCFICMFHAFYLHVSCVSSYVAYVVMTTRVCFKCRFHMFHLF
jgi:hypothetical protein